MRVLDAVRSTAVRWGMRPVAEALSTASATVRSRKFVRVRLDADGDWWHTWDTDRVLISAVPWSTPDAHVRYHHATFLFDYAPSAGDVVVDCGAGVGTELRLFSDLVGPAGRVLAIEPDPAAFRRCAKVASVLPIANVTVLSCAVSDVEGSAVLDDQGSADAVTAVLSSSPDAHGIAVDVRRLDEILADLGLDRIDYLKMNIEGYEVKALIGLGSSLEQVEHLCVSCHDFVGPEDMRTFDEVRRLLAERAFKVRVDSRAQPGDSAAWYVYASRSAA